MSQPMTDPKAIEMHKIIAAHDVEGLRAFFVRNPPPSHYLSEEQLADDVFLSDLMHVRKALDPLGFIDQREASFKHCIDKGLILVDGPVEEKEENHDGQGEAR